MTLPGRELLDDLCTRFILNSPPEELESFERMLFLVEQAHWFYEDFAREEDPTALLQSLSLKSFAKLIFQTCPALQPYSAVLDAIYKQFNDYKQAVPVMGAIMLTPGLDKCLLVKSWGPQGAWGFPRGKINPEESDIKCAAREVLEETGCDLEGKLREDHSIEVHLGQKRTKLYIVPGIPEDTPFAPLVRKEISAFAWLAVKDLPATREQDSQVFKNGQGERYKFFMVWNYVRQLRRWIRQHRNLAVPPIAASALRAPAPRGGRGKSIKLVKPSDTPAPDGDQPEGGARKKEKGDRKKHPPVKMSAAAAVAEAVQHAKSAPPVQHTAPAPNPVAQTAAARAAAAAALAKPMRMPPSELSVLLANAAAVAHASPQVGLQGWTAATSQHLPAAADPRPSPPQPAAQPPPQSPLQSASQQLQQQPQVSLAQLASNPATAGVVTSAAANGAPQTQATTGALFSSCALTAFALDREAILRYVM